MVFLTKSDFVKEHKKLIKLLRSAHKEVFTKEANEQAKELKKVFKK